MAKKAATASPVAPVTNLAALVSKGTRYQSEVNFYQAQLDEVKAEIKAILGELPTEKRYDTFLGEDGISKLKSSPYRRINLARALKLYGKKVTERVPTAAAVRAFVLDPQKLAEVTDESMSVSFKFEDEDTAS